jgi:hypothetical protein
VVNHFIPFGKHRGKAPADVPADYLLWLLRACKLSTGLRGAIRSDLIRRGVDPSRLPPQPEAAPPPNCRRCGSPEMRLYWQELGGQGGRTIRADCKRCRQFVAFVPQTPANVARADAARSPAGLLDVLTRADDEGVRLVNVGGRYIAARPRASPELEALIRQNNRLLLAMLPAQQEV